MIRRCIDPAHISYRYYGGRGISVCQDWYLSFARFIRDMGQCPSSQHSIDRIDNDGNYEAGNCQWANKSIQAQNQRRKRGIPTAVKRRLTRMPIEQALQIPTLLTQARPGTRNPHARLQEDDIRLIRSLEQGGMHKSAIARRFGVNESAIRKICKRLAWSHVK